MRVGGATFFVRTSSRRRWLIAAWHSPHSLTWRWLIDFTLLEGDARCAWPLFWKIPCKTSLQWGIRLPWLAMVSFHSQRPMWYREMYMRLRDKQDQRRTG